MRRLLWIAVLLAIGAGMASAEPAAAKDVSTMAAPDGVAVRGSGYRYVAISRGAPDRLTVVARIERRGGRLSRWWHLRGSFRVPAVAYDGSGGGLSADGGTLVLRRSSHAYPPRRSRFVILDTQRPLRRHGPGHPPGPRRYASFVELDGDFSFHAISPDGSTAYLVHRYLPPRAGAAYIANFKLRALDPSSGELLPDPIVEPSRPGPMRGLPITRATGPAGRWAYTLYVDSDGDVPHLQALNTVTGRVMRIGLPQLRGQPNPFLLRMRVVDGWRKLRLFKLSYVQGGPRKRVLSLDTPPARAETARKRGNGLLDFPRTPRHPGNVLLREGVVGRSGDGRPIRLRQLGDPAIEGSVLVFGCIHGDECAARGIEPLTNGCPDPASEVYLVRNLNPDGFAGGTRLNGRGVDLNRNFAAAWKPIGSRGGPQYSGPRPFSEPESRLAGRIVRALDPEVTIWFHQHLEPEPLVRAWGQSVAAARRFAQLARMPFRRLPWLAGTAPNWQNHAFPGSSSFVVELPPGELPDRTRARLGRAVVLLGREVGED